MESHHLCVDGVFLWGEEGGGWDVLHPHPQPHVCVCQVYLNDLDWPKMPVSGEYLLEDAMERTPKAHRLHGG